MPSSIGFLIQLVLEALQANLPAMIFELRHAILKGLI